MILNKIDLQQNYSPIGVRTKLIPQEQNSVRKTDAELLKKQLSFMGFLNSSIVKTAKKTTVSVLDNYLAKFAVINDENLNVFFDPSSASKQTKCILFKEPMDFPDALELLGEKLYHIKNNYNFLHTLSSDKCNKFKSMCQHLPELQKTQIKGVIGSGCSNTAFLPADDKIIKLSLWPSYPTEKYFIDTVEVPIIERYFFDNSNGLKVYGVKELLCEPASSNNLTELEYTKIWDDFNQKIQINNPKYSFTDFHRDDISDCKQIGFINNKPYLVDHGCIYGRPFFGGVVI